MTDSKPGADQAKNPQHQTDESHGSVKKPQTADAAAKGTDLPRGAEGDTRRASHGAR